MSDTKRASGRSRTKIERLVVEEKKEKATKVFGEGNGVALGEIEVVATYLGKIKSDHDLLKGLHMILYSSSGTQQQRKGNIRKFNGFIFDEKMNREKVESKLNAKHWTVACLKDLAQFLGLEKSGDKEELLRRVADFLEKPEAGGGETKTGGSKKKVETLKKKAETPKKKTTKRKAKAVAAEDDAGSDSDADDADEEPLKKQKVDDECDDENDDEGGDDENDEGGDEGGAEADGEADVEADGEAVADDDDDEEATLADKGEEAKDDESKDDEAKNDEAKDDEAKEDEAKDDDEAKGVDKDEEAKNGEAKGEDEDMNKDNEVEKGEE